MPYDVVTVGSATRDVFMRVKDMVVIRSRRFHTGAAECIPLGSKLSITEIVYTVGGSAANTAVTFARQKCKTACVARVGDDLRGREIERALAHEGIDTRFIRMDKTRMSAYSVVLLSKSGERSILVYRGAGTALQRRDVPSDAFRTKWFYVTHLGGDSASVFPWLVRKARSQRIKIAANPGTSQLTLPHKTILPLLKAIDILIVNREEASTLTKIPYVRHDEIFKRLDTWVKGLVVMTDGPNGVTVSDGTRRWHAGILRERRRVDRTGAGDAFGSGFIAALAHGKNVSHAIELGSANATSILEHIGAQSGILRKRDSIFRWGKLNITS